MTGRKQLRNIPASVHQRLLNLAHREAAIFNVVLKEYAAERFLYRLSVSDEVDRFVLKGASLFRIWEGRTARATRDVDLGADDAESHASIRTALETIARTPCPEDGVVFDASGIEVAEIRDDLPRSALRARIRGTLGGIRLPLQVDVGFGNAIFPEPEEREYPTFLDLPAPRLWTYPRESVIAEKLHAMVHHDVLNTRVKDLWDIACLARRFAFGGAVLRSAITETFRRCGTSFADERPIALLPAYYEDARRERLWQKLRRGMADDADGPIRLVDAGDELRRFLGPICDSLIAGSPFTQHWPAGGPWRARAPEQVESTDRV